MKTIPPAVRFCLLVSLVLLMALPALANSAVSFTFSGLQVNEQVLGYYAGGKGSFGSGPGPNYGITFSPNAVITGGRTGNLVIANSSIVMNVSSLFANSLRFAYATVAPETVSIWSGYGGTGTLLATMTLPKNWCRNISKCTWAHAVEGFSGTAASITFSGPADEFGIGSIKIGGRYWVKPQIPGAPTMVYQPVVTPEPSCLALLLTGLAGLSFIRLRLKQRLLLVRTLAPTLPHTVPR